MYPNSQLSTVKGGPPPFSPAELKQLHAQASNFIGLLRDQKRVVWEEASVLSRVEPKAYYQSILYRREYPGIEFSYIKNNNGHSESPINSRILGLFMSAGSTNKSPFGDVCFEYKFKDLVPNVFNYHLYFADFYCTEKSLNHKVTIVVCCIGSNADRFCESRGLVKLNWFNNPYFEVDADDKFRVAKGTGPDTIFIDLFYTMPLYLHIGFKRRVTYIGNGDVVINHMNRMCYGGTKNNAYCSICNVRVCAPVHW